MMPCVPLTAFGHRQFYYVFGFLALVVIILMITCSEISIVLVYFQLCSEDYNWWWRSMITSGSSGLYLFLYGIFYYATKVRSLRSEVHPASLTVRGPVRIGSCHCPS